PGTGQYEATWEPVTAGPPVGAALVHDPETGGRRPCYDMRLMLRPVDLDRMTSAAAGYAARGPVPLVLAGGPVLRDKLAAAGVLHRKDAVGQDPVWAEPGKPRRYVIDLGPILAGTLGQGGAEPPPVSPAPPVKPAEPDPDACVLCGEPTTN